MKEKKKLRSIALSAATPVLVVALGLGAANALPQHDDQDHGHHDDHHQNDRDHGHRHNDDRGRNFRFQQSDRARFDQHYRGDIDRHHWRHRPHFYRGERIPNGYRFQPVPPSYYYGAPPPPPGYQYGYYDGYVVAYNPATRIIADVLDLANQAARRR